jgi:small subunit ribosomal protein S14
MKSLIQKDKRVRKSNFKYERQRLLLKSMLYNTEITSKDQRWQASTLLSNLPKQSSRTRLKNRCIITGRGRAIHRDFRISRIKVRDLIRFNSIFGFKKSSW